jgi:hypothetical protein
LLTDYNPSAASNLILGSIAVAPGMARADVDNAIRQLMADLAPYSHGIVSNRTVKDAGALGDGTTDDSTDIQAEITSIAANGGVLDYPKGTFKQSISVTARTLSVKGKGIGTTILNPSTTTGVALRATYTAPSWDAVAYEGFTVSGTGTRQGVGFKSGPDTYSANAEYVGRSIFDRCKWDDLEKCIERPFGNIGLWIARNQFETADYHIFTKDNNSGSGDAMHAGNTIVRDSHFQYAEKASVYVEGSTVGTGQLSYHDSIWEANPGYVFYIDSINSIDGQPGLNVFNCWNEGNYTSPSVTVEGDTSAPVYARISNSPANYFHDTPIGPLRLVNSNVVTNQADLSRLSAITNDTLSTVIHDNARLFSGTAKGLVRSIGATANATGGNSPFFPMPLPQYMRANLPNVVRVFDGQSVISFTGTTTRDSVVVTNDPTLPAPFNRSQTFTINSGETMLPSSTFTVPATKWLVWQYIAKLVSGPAITVNITGASGIGGFITISDSNWRCYTGIIQNTGAAIVGDSFYHNSQGATTVIGIGGIAFLSFDSAQAALDYANSGTFPYTLGATVASASTIVLPNGQDVVTVTGTTSITSITATAADTGRTVTLVFSGALTATDGGNLKLAGNFVTTADDTLTISCDGTNWYEVCRSVN